MANWQFELDFRSFWKKEEAPVFEIAEKVSERINKLLPKIRKRSEVYQDLADDLEYDILPLFDELVEFKSENVDDFDNALEQLYDWADTALDNEWPLKRLCWVATVI